MKDLYQLKNLSDPSKFPTFMVIHHTNKKTCWLTFSYHGYSDGHSHELALGPHVRVYAHPPLLAFSIEARHRGVVGHLLRHKAHLVGVLGGGRVGGHL